MKAVPRLTVRTMGLFFNSRYRLARWTRKSKFFNRIVTKWFFDEDEMVVLPKDSVAKTRKVEMNLDIEEAGERTVLPSDVVKSVIRRLQDKIFIMDFCLCRKSNKCEDYPIDRGCIFLGNGTDRIPPEMGHHATIEETEAYLDECASKGLVHIVGRNKLDRIWLSTGSKNRLVTICNCCPCCCLWNVTRDISDEIGSSFKRMDGVDVVTDSDRCLGCGLCRDICFTRAITIEDGKSSINQKLCRGCGRCADICPAEAITLTYDETKVESESARIAALFE